MRGPKVIFLEAFAGAFVGTGCAITAVAVVGYKVAAKKMAGGFGLGAGLASMSGAHK